MKSRYRYFRPKDKINNNIYITNSEMSRGCNLYNIEGVDELDRELEMICLGEDDIGYLKSDYTELTDGEIMLELL